MKRRSKWLVAAALALVTTMVIAGCTAAKEDADMGSEETTGEYQKISPEDAKARMDSGDDIVILDVRTDSEYEEKHIPGAILKPNEEIGTEPLEELPDLDQEILVYCRSGNRSAQASKKLIEAGYTNVYDFGGISDWTYDTESGAYEGKS